MSAIEIGRVVKPHGLSGEVKVRLHWSESDALSQVGAVIVRRPNQADSELEIEAVRSSPPGLLLKLAGYDDRDSAEALRDAVLLVPRSALPALEPGEYYLCDLVGLRVVGPDGEVGEVVEVRSHPSVDSVVVKRADGSLAEQPLAEPWLDEVDLASGKIVLLSLEALI